MSSISIHDFRFIFNGYGHYKVTYTSPKTNKTWTKVISDMTLIDRTKNSENPLIKDLKELKTKVKS
jgi:hypothetical protein